MKLWRLFILLLVFPPLFASDGVEKKPFWEGFMELGYQGKNKKVNPKKAYQNIDEALAFTKAVLYHYQFDPKTYKFIEEVRGQLSSLDINQLYDFLPGRNSSTKWRGLGIKGTRESKNFEIKLQDPRLSRWMGGVNMSSFHQWVPLKKMGDSALRVFARPGKEAGYLFHTEIQSHFGKIHPQGVFQGFETMIKNLEKVAYQGATPPAPFLVKNPLATKADQRVLYQAFRDFPKLYQVFSTYTNVRSIVEAKSNRDGKYIKVGLKFKIDIGAFKDKFPLITQVWGNFKELALLRWRVYDAKGHLMFLVNINLKDFSVHLQFLAKDGRVLRCKAPWVPVSLQGFALSDFQDEKFKSMVDAKVTAKGLTLIIRALTVKLHYKNSPTGPNLFVHFNTPPSVSKVEGALFGVIPVWLIDLLIPSNLEAIIKDFIQKLAQGNFGRGFTIEIEAVEVQGEHRFRLLSNGSVTANGIVRLALAFQDASSLADPVFYKEVLRFLRLFWHAFVADYYRHRYRK